MDWNIASILAVDGLANASLYLLASVGLVMVFSVTRVLFLPFGDVAAFAALSLAALEAGRLPPTGALIMCLAVVAVLIEATHLHRNRQGNRIPVAVARILVLSALPCALAWLVAGRDDVPAFLNVLVAIALAVPIIPLVARIAIQPIADASVLALFMVSLALHFMLSGLGLLFFGPEGMRTKPLIAGNVELGDFIVSSQTLLMIACSIVLCVVLYLLFEHTISGKALRATAVNRVGARLAGIRPARTAVLVYTGASLLAGIIGVLIAPVVTMYYDSGFLIGLKAFVAATIGGMVSYPLTALGALAVGQVESFASFWTGTLKDVIVFGLLIPVLILRSALAAPALDAEGEEIDG